MSNAHIRTGRRDFEQSTKCSLMGTSVSSSPLTRPDLNDDVTLPVESLVIETYVYYCVVLIMEYRCSDTRLTLIPLSRTSTVSTLSSTGTHDETFPDSYVNNLLTFLFSFHLRVIPSACYTNSSEVIQIIYEETTYECSNDLILVCRVTLYKT